MTSLFFYGTLRDPELLHTVMGPAGDAVRITPATLPDHAACWVKDETFPIIVEREGAAAQGILLTGLSETQVARFDYYEGPFGYVLRTMTVRTGAGPTEARVFFPQPDLWQAGASFDLAEWQATTGPLSRLAAIEEMGYFGTLSGAELAGRDRMIRARAASRLAATGVPADLRSDTRRDAVEQVSLSTPHAGFFLTQVHHLRHPTFDGGMSAELRREVFVAVDAAIVLPYDPRRDRVLLVEQFRMGPYGRGDPRPWMLEPVAGHVDPGETPEESARRECIEEAGLDLHRLEHINSFYAMPGTSTEYFHCYLGLCDLPQLGQGSGGLQTEHEDIRTHVIAYDDSQALLASGEADNGPLVVALTWLALHRDRLRAVA